MIFFANAALVELFFATAWKSPERVHPPTEIPTFRFGYLSLKIVIAYVVVIIFPIYSIYNMTHINSAIKKGDYDFYQGQIVTKTDKGFKVAGLEDLDLSFLKNKTDGNKKDNIKPGDIVKIMRIDNDLSLFL